MFTIDIYIKNKRLGVLRKRIELHEKVAATYTKCRIGIANGLAKNQRGRRFSNSIAKNNNSHIHKVINVAYGYRNFRRFRARVMPILSYKRIKVGSHW